MSDLNKLPDVIAEFQQYEHRNRIWGPIIVKNGILVVKYGTDQYYPIEMENGIPIASGHLMTAKQLKQKHMGIEPEEYPMKEAIYD